MSTLQTVARRATAAGKPGARATAVVRQPLLHFLLIGAGVFGLFAWLDDTPPSRADDRIVVTEARVAQLAEGFRAVWQRPPTESEREGLIDDFIREEILVREALALGLDRDDAVIRQRLRQKMEFLTTSVAETLEPSEAELRAHYAARPQLFRTNARVAFAQVLLGEEPPPSVVAEARAALARGADPAAIGERTLLPASLPLSTANIVDGTFGRGVFETIVELPTGTWTGPVETAFGRHLVRVGEYEPARRLPFDEVRAEVEVHWRRLRAEEIAAERYARLRSAYEIVRPEDAAP